ncbi:MAG: DUF5667 domain-containing protein [Candidatus Aenigmatarchaeota archaeon]
MEEEEFKIQRNLLKTIIADTRVEILKALEIRPMTASELSKKLKKHVTTVSEHLDLLKNSNLVERLERPGRKWVYYKLTKEGKKVLHPESYRWIAIIAISFLLVLTYFIFTVDAYPGSIFYGIKRTRENLILSLTRNETQRLMKNLEFAEERLKEAKWLVEKEREEDFEDVLEDYESKMEEVEKALESEKSQKVLEDVSESIPKHISILRNILTKTEKIRILKTINKTSEIYELSISELRNVTRKPYMPLFKHD